MNITKASSPVQNERAKTDQSLGAEREKTNITFAFEKHRAESEIDSLVNQGRLDADAQSTEERADTDAGVFKVDRKILEERDRADEATERERKKVDEAIDKERESKKILANKLFKLERELTDKNLSVERMQSDKSEKNTSSLLSLEQAGHASTRAELTTREEFLSVVSHDLRNPIGAISSCAQMMLSDPDLSEMTSEMRHWVAFMKRNADSALRLIGDLLETERIASGKLKLNLARHSITDLVAASVENFRQQAISRNIDLRLIVAEKELSAIFDSDRIAQVCGNLIGNALKYTEDGGVVTVSSARAHGFVEICIADNGSGIAEDKVGRIFERHSQLASRDQSGLGLGLYISKSFMDAHGGNLTVASKPGVGSTFTLRLKDDGPTA